MAYSPYTISIADSRIDDLKQRLFLARFPDELDSAAWDLGAPLADVKRLTAYWRDRYDWKQAESKLNELPHYTTEIHVDGYDPLQIHFMYKKSNNTSAIPLLFVHGWPGSFIEGTKILQELSHGTGSAPSFDVVVISLPNFGFSSGLCRRGFAIEQYAETCHKLMLKLGYNEYVTQGGDWGYYITRAISLLYPQHCKATHVNFDQGFQPTLTKHPILAIEHALRPYNAYEREGGKRMDWFLKEGSGYRSQQSTKPQTLGYALADSPVALLAWMYEKLHDWTDSYPWTEDEICTWISIYWFSTAGPAASVRIYYEATHTWNDPVRKITRDRTCRYIPHVKLGLSHNPKELRVLPSTWTRTQGNVVFERYHSSGGHFFAWERPEHCIQDMRDMFGKGGGAYGCVKGKDGYGAVAKL